MADKVKNKIMNCEFQKKHGRCSHTQKRVEGIFVMIIRNIFTQSPLPQEIFTDMDQDQSGSVTQLELYKFIVKVHKMEDDENTKVDWNEVKKIFKSLDKDGDRCVDWEEFFVKLSLYYRVFQLYLSGCRHQQDE